MPLYNLDELWDGCVIICPDCKGRGIRLIEDHDGRYAFYDKTYKDVVCCQCDGEGRVELHFEKIGPLKNKKS